MKKSLVVILIFLLLGSLLLIFLFLASSYFVSSIDGDNYVKEYQSLSNSVVFDANRKCVMLRIGDGYKNVICDVDSVYNVNSTQYCKVDDKTYEIDLNNGALTPVFAKFSR